jgi:hypothetical protein
MDTQGQIAQAGVQARDRSVDFIREIRVIRGSI